MVDPTITRLSDTLLLSDVIGCDSVYRYGYPNNLEDTELLKEGRFLGALLDILQEELGPYSVCYGYISPSLSRKIVTYQDPDKASYHRWDLGAAVDVCFHEQNSPIETAFAINEHPYARLITYAESECICLATQASSLPKRVFYENQYIGGREPQRIIYSQNPKVRERQIQEHDLPCDWRGQGWPSYHGRGRRQFEHYRISPYTHMISFLYDRLQVRDGVKNSPPLLNRSKMFRWSLLVKEAASIIDAIAITHRTRVSITKAFSQDPRQSWHDRFTLEIVPPTFLDIEDAAHTISSLPAVKKIVISKHKEPRIQIVGFNLDDHT